MGTKVKRFQINSDAVDSAKIADNSIVDADVSISADIAQSKIHNLESDLENKINLNGDTFTGVLTLNADPTQPMHAATKNYVDTLAENFHVTDFEVISSIETIGNNIVIGPYAIAVGNSAMINNSGTSIDLTNTSNFESGNTSTGTYYIYATGSDFKLSTSVPSFLNGFWKHPSQNWKPIGSVIKLSTGFIPFIKYDNMVLFKSNINLGSPISTTIVRVPVSATFALVSMYTVASGTHDSASYSSTLSILDPDLNTTIDNIFTAGAVGGSAYRAVATADRQNTMSPITFSGTTASIKASGSDIVYQNGYIENF
jgi:hypothetical protein